MRLLKAPLIIVFIWPTFLMAQPFNQVHPRLFFDSNEMVGIRAKLTVPPYNYMFADMVALFNRYYDTADVVLNPEYDQADGAALGGFLYQLTLNDTFARKSAELVRKRITDTRSTSKWASTAVKGLNSYTYGTFVAWAYDWCYHAPSWSVAFRDSVSKALLAQANMIITHGGTEQNTNNASNWQGIRGAAGGFCMMAHDEAFNATHFQTTLEKVERWYFENYGNSRNNSGWNVEGLGYTYYPTGNFVGPFGITLKRLNPLADFRENAGAVMQYHSIYSTFVNSIDVGGFGGLHPDFGDDNPGISGEGVFGQSFYYLPPTFKPLAKYWYDSTVAVRPQYRYDARRLGLIWSFLYYPSNLNSSNPINSPAWKKFFADFSGNGYFTFRNNYLNRNDFVSQIYLKYRGNKGHNGPDALSFRILGNGGAFAVGGGRYGPKINNVDAYFYSMNTLYYKNPNTILKADISGNSGVRVGYPLIKPDGSGHVISKIVKNNVGVNNHKRWYITDYDKTSTNADAVVVIADKSDDGIFWQLCSYSGNTVTTHPDGFTITEPTGNSMKATILYQTGAKNIITGRRLRGSRFHDTDTNSYVFFNSDNGQYVVALTFVKVGQPHPIVTGNGSGVEGFVVNVGAKQYTILDSTVLYNQIAVNAYPFAQAEVNKTSLQPNDSVWFDASSSIDEAILQLQYKWFFGDGATATTKNATHTYSVAGEYRPMLVVTDTGGLTDTMGLFITVNQAPTVNLKPFAQLALPANNSVFNANQTVYVLPWLEDTDGYISKIELYSGATLMASDETYPFYFDWTNMPTGVHNISIKAYDNNGATVQTSTRKVTINPPLFLGNNSDKFEFKIYPNPTSGNLYIAFEEKVPNDIKIFDVNGKLINQLNGTDIGADNELNMYLEKCGIYFLVANFNDQIITKKIIVNR